MPIAEQDVKWIEEPRLSLLENLYFPTIFSGIMTTAKHLGRTLAGNKSGMGTHDACVSSGLSRKNITNDKLYRTTAFFCFAAEAGDS